MNFRIKKIQNLIINLKKSVRSRRFRGREGGGEEARRECNRRRS